MDRIDRGAMVVMNRSLPPLAVLLACACLPFTKSVGEASTSEAASSSDDGSTTDGVPLGNEESPVEPSSTSGSTDDTTGDPTGDPPSFACPPQQDEQQCDPLAQDCPGDFHCVPWIDNIEGFIEAFVCAPLVDEPAGLYEECTSDPATCSDSCEEGTYCYPEHPTGPEGPGGLCVSPCSADGDDATCQAGEVCVTCATCDVGTCFPSCDPLAPQCPDQAPACLWMQNEGFACMPAEYLGPYEPGDVCEFQNVCVEGLVCADASVVGTCAGPSCCTEPCDLVDGDPACSDPTHACIPAYPPGTAPAGLEHVGLCGVP